MRVDFFPPFFYVVFLFFLIVFLVQACLWIHLLHIQIKEDHRHQAIYRFTVDSCFNQQRCFTGTFVHGPVDSFKVAAGSDLRHKDWKRNKDTVFPSCSSSQAGFCSDSGSQSYKTTRTYLTFSPKSIQFLSGMSVMPLSLGKPFFHHPRGSVSSCPIQHHLSLRSRFSCSSASAFCPDRPQMTAGLIRQTLSPHCRIDY